MNVEHLPIPRGHRLHPERKHFLTASNIASAAGCDEWKTALDLHLEMTGRRPPIAENPQMIRGRLGEPMIKGYLAERLPRWRMLEPRVFLVERSLRIGATPDLLLEDPDDPGLVNAQLKMVGAPAFARWPIDAVGNVVAPIAYQLQTAMENMLLDAKGGLLAVLVMSAFNAELEVFEVPRHPAAERRVLEVAAAFWRRIDNGILPAPDYERDGERLAELYPPDLRIEVPVDLSSDNRIGVLVEEYERLGSLVTTTKKAKETVKNEITDKLRGATLALTPGWKITNKMQHRDEYTVAAQDYPVLRVTRTKEAA